MTLTIILYFIAVALLIFCIFHEDSFIKWEEDWKDIFHSCRRNNIGFFKFVKIFITAAAQEIREEKNKISKTPLFLIISFILYCVAMSFLMASLLFVLAVYIG